MSTNANSTFLLVLLQLHRFYFIRALSCPEEALNRRHKYAPSVVAVFMSASRMIAMVQELFQKEPDKTARIMWYWSNAFSATVSLRNVCLRSISLRLWCILGCIVCVGVKSTIYMLIPRNATGTKESETLVQRSERCLSAGFTGPGKSLLISFIS